MERPLVTDSEKNAHIFDTASQKEDALISRMPVRTSASVRRARVALATQANLNNDGDEI